MEQAADIAAVIVDGAERKGKACLFQISVPVEKHSLVFEISCLAGECTLKSLANGWPRRGPACRKVLSHRQRMLGAADRPVTVVINLNVMGPQTTEMGKLDDKHGLTVVRRLCGHDSRLPSDVSLQSIAPTSLPIWPPPASQPVRFATSGLIWPHSSRAKPRQG